MGEFKETATDNEAWTPTGEDFLKMQNSAAFGHLTELKRFLEEKETRLKFYREKMTEADFELALKIIADMEKTLE